MRKRKTEERIKAIEMHKQEFHEGGLLKNLVLVLILLKHGYLYIRADRRTYWMIQGKKEPTARL